ncbi:MAG: plasmid stabilization protein [Planctomycetes bacterium RIFOXYD2_FULL_41_16]|nr:MAG: plasmid stabilization protein [Planctomycetes bacterium GWE2_41_14]OHC05511.1 MAG: plasmid stabilization protein [Planctomycetes bacterium RIFOXYC2_FULL_41_27]OHC07976.1 MAG: plasmid stabilization protein [Planctomycetes bacterium RIFOXYD2_FULL_41_16]
MEIKFLAPAENEFLDAISYYNMQSEGLGYEFAAEVKKTIERIIQYPEAWAKLSKRTRRCRTNRFPYGVIYQVREETLLIVAVMHLGREPQGWKSRLRNEEL